MNRILILGACGQVSQFLIKDLLKETDLKLNLLARNATQRLHTSNNQREHVFNGNFNNKKSLLVAMRDVDCVYLDDMSSVNATKTVVKAMQKSHINRLICMNVLGIYHEVPGAFGRWNQRMVGPYLPPYIKTAKIVEHSGLNYTMPRLTWLYNKDGDTAYEVTKQNEPLRNTQITRQAVAQFVVDLIKNDKPEYHRTSVGLGKPNTYFDKPSFY